jgi:hypothetical protein
MESKIVWNAVDASQVTAWESPLEKVCSIIQQDRLM